jgi:hypothetical protein
VVGHGLHQLTLGQGHRLDGPEQLGVDRRHHRDHGDSRTGHIAEQSDVTGTPGPHLDHRHLGVIGCVGQGEGDPELGVEGAFAGRHPPPPGQGGGGQVLGRCLAHRTGDPDDRGLQPSPGGPTQIEQGGTGVGHLDHPGVGRETPGPAGLDQHGSGSSRQGRRGEVVAVPFGHHGDEQVPGFGAAGVEGDPDQLRLGMARGAPAPGGGGDVGDGPEHGTDLAKRRPGTPGVGALDSLPRCRPPPHYR